MSIEIELSVQDMCARVCPDSGGAVTSFCIGDQPLLRSSSADDLRSGDPLRLACFSLVPYSNRIANGRFRWREQRYELAKNFADHPHTLHGCGWRRRWTVTDMNSSALTCEMHHRPDSGDPEWPWPFDARQDIVLTEDTLTISVSVRNLAEVEVPVGLGFHPYFDCDEETVVDIEFDGEWQTDEFCLPTQYLAYERRQNPWAQGVSTRSADGAFAGRSPVALVSWPNRRYRVSLGASDNLAYTVMYVPGQPRFFCIEPVSHLPNAHNYPDPLSHGLQTLSPNEQMSGVMALTAIAA